MNITEIFTIENYDEERECWDKNKDYNTGELLEFDSVDACIDWIRDCLFEGGFIFPEDHEDSTLLFRVKNISDEVVFKQEFLRTGDVK
jgi:hypothetical protein